MKKLLAFLALVIAGTIALGFYLGWFQLSSNKEGDRSNITITVDKTKIQADKDKAVDRLQDLGDKAKSPEAPPPPPPESDPAEPAEPPAPPEQP
jgi:type IV secretory pathway VirB10-like protein